MKNQNLNPQITDRVPAMTPLEFGFMHQEQGPQFIPDESDLPKVYQGLVDKPLNTQLLVTDQDNPVLITSLIKFHNKISDIASRIEPSGRTQYSEDVQGYFLKGVKDFIDEGGRNTKRMTQCIEPLFYRGTTGTNNGRLLRVYFMPVGTYEGIPVVAKLGACRTKEDEAKLYRAFGNKNTGKV